MMNSETVIKHERFASREEKNNDVGRVNIPSNNFKLEQPLAENYSKVSSNKERVALTVAVI